VNCDEFVELVTAYLDGALGPEDEQRMTEHLSECDGCTTYLGQFRSTVEALAQLDEPRLADTTRDSLLAKFRGKHV
jgi:anti-sigma factor RsiW